MRELLTPKQVEYKYTGIKRTVEVLEKLGFEYFLGGNILLDIFREKDVSSWPYGIAIAVRAEELQEKFSELRNALELAGFRVTKNANPLRLKINAYYKNRLCEIVGWFLNDTGEYRVRAKYKLPVKFFTPGHFEKLRDKMYQTFNPPIEYFLYRFGENWRTPIRTDGRHRQKYENERYWRKKKK